MTYCVFSPPNAISQGPVIRRMHRRSGVAIQSERNRKKRGQTPSGRFDRNYSAPRQRYLSPRRRRRGACRDRHRRARVPHPPGRAAARLNLRCLVMYSGLWRPGGKAYEVLQRFGLWHPGEHPRPVQEALHALPSARRSRHQKTPWPAARLHHRDPP